MQTCDGVINCVSTICDIYSKPDVDMVGVIPELVCNTTNPDNVTCLCFSSSPSFLEGISLAEIVGLQSNAHGSYQEIQDTLIMCINGSQCVDEICLLYAEYKNVYMVGVVPLVSENSQTCIGNLTLSVY